LEPGASLNDILCDAGLETAKHAQALQVCQKSLRSHHKPSTYPPKEVFSEFCIPQEELALACAHLKDYDQRLQELEEAKGQVEAADAHKAAALATLHEQVLSPLLSHPQELPLTRAHEQLVQVQQEMQQREAAVSRSSDSLRAELQASQDEVSALASQLAQQTAQIKVGRVQGI